MGKRQAKVYVGMLFAFILFVFSTPAVAEKSIDLRLSSFLPSMHFMNVRIIEPWIADIEKRTGGKVKIKIYAGGSLGKPQEQFDMAARGVADITWGILAYTPGRFPLATVVELPFMSPSAEIGSRMVQRLFDGGYFQDEFDEVKLLTLAMPPNMDLHSRKHRVEKFEDIKGMKIRTPSAMIGELIKNCGGVPVAMPAPDVYMSLERGVIDSIFLDPLTLMGLKINEVTKYHTRVGISTTVLFFAMNKKTWDKLPSDVQKVFDELSGEHLGADLNGKIADRTVLGVLKKLAQSGDEVIALSPGEMEKWKNAAQPAFDTWLKAMEKKGLPGKKVLDEAYKLRKELSGS